MAKFRMVPDDADEAKFIHELIKAHNTTALMEAAKTGDVGLMNKLTSREIRWQVIATELAAGDDEPEPEKSAAPAKQRSKTGPTQRDIQGIQSPKGPVAPEAK